MKKQILSVVVTLSVIITLSVAGFAGLSTSLKANIPFDFTVGGKKLLAGQYIVEQGVVRGALVIRNAETKKAIAVMAMEIQNDNDSKPKLTFRRYGNQYFLAKVIGVTGGNELPKTKAEREAAKAVRDHLTMNEATPEIVTVSAQAG
ncbi:MAG: hypothetical protein L0226_15245 [Acidobacteria bacterium]|nr:hypothetical protein [Acidobacteriota bacterium]